MPRTTIDRKYHRAHSLDSTSTRRPQNMSTDSPNNQSILRRMDRTVAQNAIGSAAGDLAISDRVSNESHRSLVQRTFRHVANPRYYDNSWWWNTNNYSSIKGRSISDTHAYSGKSIEHLIEIGLMMMNNANVIISFGAAKGGFNFAMALRDEIYQRILKQSSSEAPLSVYLDAQSMIVHPATEWPWSRFVGAPGMANPFWDIMYHAGVENSDIMIFNVSEAWLRSPYCYEELQMFRERKAHDDSFPGLFIFNDDSRRVLSGENQELIKEGAKFGSRDKAAIMRELNEVLNMNNVSRIDVMANARTIPISYQVDEVSDFRFMEPEEVGKLTEDDVCKPFKKAYDDDLKFVIESTEMDRIAEAIGRALRR